MGDFEFRYEKINLINLTGLGQPPRRFAIAVGQQWQGERKGTCKDLVAINLDDVWFDLNFDEAASLVFARRASTSPFYMHTVLLEHNNYLYTPMSSLYWDAAKDMSWMTREALLLPAVKGSNITARSFTPDLTNPEFKKDLDNIISSVTPELETALDALVAPLVHESSAEGCSLEEVAKAVIRAQASAKHSRR
ncbi:hypothetical protein GOV07_00280 [Candidatus Woesearchaeota archaeon]|nr:hypothetical protein [Candidatus Woesearchaeota archaeon]